MNMSVLAVDVKHCGTYDFLRDNETKEQLLQRANEAKQKDITV